MAQWEFVLAKPEQTTEIFALFTAAIERMRQNGVEQWDEIYPAFADIQRDVANGELYVAAKAGRILASVTLNGDQSPEYAAGDWKFTGGPVAAVHRLCVHPDTQGKGLGKWMMQTAEDFLRREGFAAVRLDAFVDNPVSNAMYQSLGCRTAGEVRFRKGRFLLYEKSLV